MLYYVSNGLKNNILWKLLTVRSSMGNAQTLKLDTELTELASIAESFSYKPVIYTMLGRHSKEDFEYWFEDLLGDNHICSSRLLNECYIKKLNRVNELQELYLLSKEEPGEAGFSAVNPEYQDNSVEDLASEENLYLAAYANPSHTELLGFLVIGRHLLHEPPQYDYAEDLTYGINIEAFYTRKNARGRGVATYLSVAFLNAISEDMRVLHERLPEGCNASIHFYSEWLSEGGARACLNIVNCVSLIKMMHSYKKFEISVDMGY